MSRCRCGDIQSCNVAIQCLLNAHGSLGECAGRLGNVQDNLQNLVITCQNAMAISEGTGFSMELNSLDDDMRDAYDKIKNALLSRERELQNELSKMKSEDEQFHREEAQRKAEEARRAEEARKAEEAQKAEELRLAEENRLKNVAKNIKRYRR